MALFFLRTCGQACTAGVTSTGEGSASVIVFANAATIAKAVGPEPCDRSRIGLTRRIVTSPVLDMVKTGLSSCSAESRVPFSFVSPRRRQCP